VTGVFGVFLAASAAFGGLNTVVPPPIPVIEAGEPFTGAQLRIAVERAVLIDGFPENDITPADGNRLLVVVTRVENVWDEPAVTLGDESAAQNVRPTGVAGIDAGTEPLSVAVLSDGAEYPELQPGVPVELAYIWEVAPDALGKGDTIGVDIYDKTFRAEGFVTYGERFENPFVAASTDLTVDDVGAGVSE
jgi:hypothetical protein